MKLTEVDNLRTFLTHGTRRIRKHHAYKRDVRGEQAIRSSRSLGLSPTIRFIIKRDMPRPEARN